MDGIKLQCTTVATKINPVDRIRLEYVAEAFHLSFYELLQGVLTGLLRYFDEGVNVTSDKNILVNALGNIMLSLDGSFSPIALKGRCNNKINKCFMFIDRSDKKKKVRPQIVALEKKENGIIKESYNFDEMLTSFLNSCDPEILDALNREKKKNGYFSVFHTLHDLILERAEKPKDEMAADVNEMFQDIRVAGVDNGVINDDVIYNRKRRTGNAEDYTHLNTGIDYNKERRI